MLENIVEKGHEVELELIKKYEPILPNELLKLWTEYGFANLLGGYLRVINPEVYQGLLEETYFRGKVSVPILTTAFGDIVTLEEGMYIGLIKYKNGNSVILAKNFKRFVQNLEDDYFLEKYFQVSEYIEATKKLGKLENEQCFGYVPLLGLGGSEKIGNLNKVNIREHIELISQLVGKIGL